VVAERGVARRTLVSELDKEDHDDCGRPCQGSALLGRTEAEQELPTLFNVRVVCESGAASELGSSGGRMDKTENPRGWPVALSSGIIESYASWTEIQ